ncbi:type VI secretion system protein TssA [Roseateles sp.]|uniref:type VI secretion system protein TssA n=1 Tax=Roseateles sp. TaxID=1971397 RepID=UPI0039EC0AB5
MSSQATLDLETLWSPLSADAPGGADLEYDPQFVALELAGAGKPERQYGETVYPAEPPDWPQVHELAQQLSARTRDLRVAVWLVRSRARLFGLPGAAQALLLTAGLLERLWDGVHPQLDTHDGNDPTMRVSALAPLGAGGPVLTDLRAAALAPVRGSLTLRELEIGLGLDDPWPGEARPTETGALQALSGLLSEHPEAGAAITDAARAVSQIAATLESRIAAGNGLDFAPLTRLLEHAGQALRRTTGAVTEAEAVAPAAAPDGVAGAPARSRADVIRQLEQICQWIESHEPSNPAPLLIRRAQRLMDKSFIEIIRDLAPDGLGQVERIAGPETTA